MSSDAFYTRHDIKPGMTVPVIASFDSEGRVRPLYVRIGELSLKVASFWLKPTFLYMMEFHCMVIDGDIKRPLILSFHQKTSTWIIPYLTDELQ